MQGPNDTSITPHLKALPASGKAVCELYTQAEFSFLGRHFSCTSRKKSQRQKRSIFAPNSLLWGFYILVLYFPRYTCHLTIDTHGELRTPRENLLLSPSGTTRGALGSAPTSPGQEQASVVSGSTSVS